jgi:hypothetical protein
MNSIKQLWGGAVEIFEWLRAGGHVVTFKEAQWRTNVCNTCSKNVEVGKLKLFIAWFVRKALEIKNRTNLRTRDAGSLGQCQDCGCVLRILVLEPQDRIEPFLDDEDRGRLPKFCWKLKKP